MNVRAQTNVITSVFSVFVLLAGLTALIFFYGKQRGTLLVLKIKYLAQNFSNFTFYLLVI